jgi:hypothetical protein
LISVCSLKTKPKEFVMIRHVTIAVCAMALLSVAASVALAQNSPPTYEADPSVYKVIFEDQNFRVIAATWKAGTTDKPHAHPVPSVAYALTDCTLKLTTPDGKTTIVNNKAGAVTAPPITPSHTAENTGSRDCQGILVERK